MPKTLFVIDAYNLIYRMFYAIPEMHTRDDKPVNAIFWVVKFLKWLIEENPDACVVVATDVGQSFRAEVYPEYKAQRDRMPDNLRSQIDGVFEFFDIAGLQVIARPGYEADDIIGSIAHQHENDEYQVVIISSDKDLCQFVKDGKVHIYDAMKRKFMKEKDVLEKFGVPVHQVCDYLAIVGDTSDNIPWIAGFGPKKASDLLSKYDTLQGIYDHIEEISPKMREILIDQRENAFLSQKLASIVTSLEVDIDVLCAWDTSGMFVQAPVIDLLKAYEFRSLIPRALLEEKKKLEIPRAISVETGELLSALTQKILEESKTRKNIPLFLATDTEGNIALTLQDEIYTLDTRKVEASSFIDFLFTLEDIEIVGYDLKEDYKNLLAFKKPLQGVEGQGRLF